MGPSFPLPNTLMQLSGILISQSGPYFPERKRMSSLYFRVFNILIVRLYRKDHVPVGSTRILETKILVVLLTGCLHQELISVFPGGGYGPAGSTRNFESKIIVVLLGLAPPL